MQTDSDDVLLTVTEAARLLALKGRRGLDRMRQEGRGPVFVRLGTGSRPRVRYRRRDLAEFLETVTEPQPKQR